jgi:hypothetical protein
MVVEHDLSKSSNSSNSNRSSSSYSSPLRPVEMVIQLGRLVYSCRRSSVRYMEPVEEQPAEPEVDLIKGIGDIHVQDNITFSSVESINKTG